MTEWEAALNALRGGPVTQRPGRAPPSAIFAGDPEANRSAALAIASALARPAKTLAAYAGFEGEGIPPVRGGADSDWNHAMMKALQGRGNIPAAMNYAGKVQGERDADEAFLKDTALGFAGQVGPKLIAKGLRGVWYHGTNDPKFAPSNKRPLYLTKDKDEALAFAQMWSDTLRRDSATPHLVRTRLTPGSVKDIDTEMMALTERGYDIGRAAEIAARHARMKGAQYAEHLHPSLTSSGMDDITVRMALRPEEQLRIIDILRKYGIPGAGVAGAGALGAAPDQVSAAEATAIARALRENATMPP